MAILCQVHHQTVPSATESRPSINTTSSPSTLLCPISIHQITNHSSIHNQPVNLQPTRKTQQFHKAQIDPLCPFSSEEPEVTPSPESFTHHRETTMMLIDYHHRRSVSFSAAVD
ncbi:hypothetical protein M0R45_002312 [Rubus argutus]|uniref:Uncharacterized protein n=1 Tax=Rubus argutus TaxID=59490 RepID=A0AAW1VI82_RUBAR